MRSIWRRRLSNGRHACKAVGRSIGFSSVFAGTLVAGSAMDRPPFMRSWSWKTTENQLEPVSVGSPRTLGATDISKALRIGRASVYQVLELGHYWPVLVSDQPFWVDRGAS